jgi:hypothetical protein
MTSTFDFVSDPYQLDLERQTSSLWSSPNKTRGLSMRDISFLTIGSLQVRYSDDYDYLPTAKIPRLFQVLLVDRQFNIMSSILVNVDDVTNNKIVAIEHGSMPSSAKLNANSELDSWFLVPDNLSLYNDSRPLPSNKIRLNGPTGKVWVSDFSWLADEIATRLQKSSDVSRSLGSFEDAIGGILENRSLMQTGIHTL